MGAAIPRAAFGGTAQVTTFAMTKDWMTEKNLFANHPLFQSFLSSMLSGIVVCLVMQPFDVVSTRLYNQGNTEKMLLSISNNLKTYHFDTLIIISQFSYTLCIFNYCGLIRV